MIVRYFSAVLFFVPIFARIGFCLDVPPPAIYVDKGACPGEGCGYGDNWKVKKDTALLAEPDDRSKKVGNCNKGSEVLAETGEVHTKRGEFKVKKEHGQFKPGDTLWVYTYYGEGFFKVWVNGEFKNLELSFSPWGGSPGARCESAPSLCWGELKEKLEFSWWVQIKTPNGVTGWTRRTDNFDTSGEKEW